SGFVGAFRQPNAARTASVMFAVIVYGDAYLRTACFFGGDQRQKAVRRAAGDYFQNAFVLQPAKSRDQIVFVNFVPKMERCGKARRIHLGGIHEFGPFAACAFDLFLGEFGEFFEMRGVSFLQERIGQHFAYAWRNVHRKPRFYTAFQQVFENENERKIDLGYRLVKPIFFEKFGIFGMPHERKMCVKDKAEISERHILRIRKFVRLSKAAAGRTDRQKFSAARNATESLLKMDAAFPEDKR